MFNFRSEDYIKNHVDNIIFKYFEIPKDIEDRYLEKWDEIKPSLPIKLEKFGQYKLPLNIDYYNWINKIKYKIFIKKIFFLILIEYLFLKMIIFYSILQINL